MAGNTDKPNFVEEFFMLFMTIISLVQPLRAGSSELPNMFLHQSGFAAAERHRPAERALTLTFHL